MQNSYLKWIEIRSKSRLSTLFLRFPWFLFSLTFFNFPPYSVVCSFVFSRPRRVGIANVAKRFVNWQSDNNPFDFFTIGLRFRVENSKPFITVWFAPQFDIQTVTHGLKPLSILFLTKNFFEILGSTLLYFLHFFEFFQS